MTVGPVNFSSKNMTHPNGSAMTNNSSETTQEDRGQKCINCWSKFNEVLIRAFYSYGHVVGRYPWYFVIIPVIISAILSTGLLHIRYVDDPMELFVPFSSPSLQDVALINRTFPVDYSDNFSAARFVNHRGHSRIIITAKDGGSVLRGFLWKDVRDLYDLVISIPIEDERGREVVYKDICAKWKGRCYHNSILNLEDDIYSIENGSMLIDYPIPTFPFVLPQFLGGLTVNRSGGYVIDSKALLLAFFTNVQDGEKIAVSNRWERTLIEVIKNVEYDNIIPSLYTSLSVEDELRIKMDSCLPFLPLTGFIMITTCMLMLWTSDAVRSKPLVGLAGLVSAMIAAGAAFGILMFIGVPYTRLNIVTLFLVLGIGVDDMFVAISAWQKTDINDPIPARLAQTYGHAAVSVTITSLTNCLSFAVGITTPVFIVRNFCLYCGVTIAFSYFLFITFCGGFLALAGRMEQNRRHSLLLIKVKKIPEREKVNPIRKLFFYSELVEQDNGPGRPMQIKDHMISAFFRDFIGDILQKSFVKAIIVIMYLIYLGGAIYGCYSLKQGLYRTRMARDDSYFTQFSHFDDVYFRSLPYYIQVVVTGNLNYSDPEVQKQYMELINNYENSNYGSYPVFTRSWYREYLGYLRRRRAPIKDEEEFIKILKERYFINPNNDAILDVKYNEDNTQIIASRFIFQSGPVKDVYDDVLMMDTFRKIAENSPLNATVYHALFSLFDQHDLIKSMALQSIIIAIILVILVSLIFIPNPWGSLAMALSILSIAAGVVGYMAFWDINLDHVSMGSIFMCIGFSVDFSAHITFTYMSSQELTTEGKTRESLFGLGLPIIQGGLTTIFSLITFLIIPGYGYRTFFKTILMVTLFAIFHSIFLIPLFLSTILGCCRKSSRREPVSILTYQKRNSIYKISDAAYYPKPIVRNGTTPLKEPIQQNGHARNGHIISYGSTKMNGVNRNGVDNGAFRLDEQ